MEKIVARHKNLTVLAVALFVQLLVLGIQVKRPGDGGISLLRVWTIRAITPFEKAAVYTSNWVGDTWHSYFYLRGLRAENERLENENIQLRLEQVRTIQDASQARRLQALLKFKEQYVAATVAAQVIGTSGTETSRILIIDKGANDGLANDMAVITPRGVVGKIMRVQPSTAQVLEINDQTSGVGAILETSRLQGILKGSPDGQAYVRYIMADEKVEVGERVLTSGGDRIFPKGLPIGTVVSTKPGSDMLEIRVKPAARLDRVEEVLVITKVDDQQPDLLPENPLRAADILAARLPSVPVKPPDATTPGQPGAEAAQGQSATQGQAAQTKPAGAGATTRPTEAATPKPAARNGGPLGVPKPAIKPAGSGIGQTGSGQSGSAAQGVKRTPNENSASPAGGTGSTAKKPASPVRGSATAPKPAQPGAQRAQ